MPQWPFVFANVDSRWIPMSDHDDGFAFTTRC